MSQISNLVYSIKSKFKKNILLIPMWNECFLIIICISSIIIILSKVGLQFILQYSIYLFQYAFYNFLNSQMLITSFKSTTKDTLLFILFGASHVSFNIIFLLIRIFFKFRITRLVHILMIAGLIPVFFGCYFN